MTIGYRDILAILLLLFYVPCLFASCILIFRHGWWQSWWTWFVLATFSISRIAYSAVQLATYTHPDSTSLRAAAATLAVDGLSPLLFMSLGLVHRLRDHIWRDHPHVPMTRALSLRVLRLQEALVTAAFICASVGYRGLSKDEVVNGIAKHSSVLKAAAAMYVVACAGIALATAELCTRYRAYVPAPERKVLLVLVVGFPLCCIRTVYTAIDVLGDVQRFSAISGDVTVFLCMALLEEAVIAAMYLVLGFVVRVISKEEWNEMQEAVKNSEPRKKGQEESVDGESLVRVDLESGRARQERI